MSLIGLISKSGKVSTRPSWQRAADRIEQLESELQSLSDHRLRKMSLSFRYEILSGRPLDSIMIPAFALVRETARRQIGLRHYRVQIIGGIAMHQGAVAVMQTGEGKTLAATMPLYLAALTGRGCHLATANDYLANRDAQLMRPIFESLGLSVGVVQSATKPPQRRKAYACDVTYSTAKEIGFDFLRDRLLKRRIDDEGETAIGVDQDDRDWQSTVQRELHFMLVDEADSILIDEARTPLIISSLPDSAEQTQCLYRWTAQAIDDYSSDKHYHYDEEKRTVQLTVAGRTLARKKARPRQLAEVGLPEIYDQLELALLVRHQFVRDRHYVVREGEVVIVDEFTGRMTEGRKWRAGLHQAIEARENLEITCETAEAARITIQDLFLRYERLAGMTGTVANSGRELHKIYKVGVVHIPTNRPPQRKRLADQVLGTAEAKWSEIVSEISLMSRRGRPVLVGTRSIDKSERLSALLSKNGIEHQVLNARQLEREAEIIAQAGIAGRITVATNMAGRGTDIQIDATARKNGGLHVILSEVHESARIDRQLIGRCGRQGDPGSFRYYMALDDDILLAGLGPRMAQRLKTLGKKRARQPSNLARYFRLAQQRVERKHFKGRKMLLFLEKQRQSVQRDLGQDPYVDTIA